MDEKSIYWSYAGKPDNENIIIEHTLKYADIESIKELMNNFGIDKCKQVWERTMLPDKRLRKLNYFLAKFIFKISNDDAIINEYFNHHKITRAGRINEIFNR
jgi:hypothetical protein